MPNWVTQQLVFKGEQSELDKIEEYVKSEKRRFDFNKVIPRPEEYAIEKLMLLTHEQKN